MANNYKAVSLDKLTEPRVICAVAGEWGEPTSGPCGLIIAILRNQLRKVEVPNVDVHEH
jgi:hypothetical protein